jgi:2,4-dienoyl-CoA reductase-like NADH-dependent reductase (Old Yellow Enzyme family)
MSAAMKRAASPYDLASLTLRNRLVGTAHGAGLVVDGLPQPADADYWRRRAAGGAAMLIVGGTVTAPESTWRRRIVTEAWREEAVPGMALRAEAIRSEGAIAACQLVHLGRETTGAEMWFAPVAPSALRSPREPTRPRALTDTELDAIVEGFRASAVNAVQAGFQVIELHAAHGYLLAQFLSPASNLRPGAEHPEGRVKIVGRILDAIRSSVPHAVLGVRVSGEGGQEAGHTLEGLCQLLPLLSALADYVNVTVGVRSTYVKDMATEQPPLLEQIDRIRAVVDRPLLLSQAFRTGEQIERALAAGADLIGMARPLIADPDVPAKLLSGRDAEVRPCVSCNEDCRAFDPVLLCTVNPELAPPGMTHRPAAPLVVRRGAGSGGRVAVVGAGPAGLECATALARAGHPVTLFDQREELGGQLTIAAAAPNRHGWRSLLRFYEHALAAADGAELRLGEAAGAAELEPFPEVVIAVGSEEILSPVEGIERAQSASQAIRRGPRALGRDERVLIVDDGFGYWPCASAVELAIAAGARQIVLATPGAAFGASLPGEGRAQLLQRLRGAPLDVRPFTALESIGQGSAVLRNVMSGEPSTLTTDVVIVVGERRARDWSELAPASATVRVIGDAVVPRKVAPAISEGRAAAEAIAAVQQGKEVTAPV